MRVRERTALYRFRDRGGALLYVGITNNLERRWEQHAADKPWWPQVHERTVQWYGARNAALRSEELAILRERPRYNIQHNENNPDRIPYRKLATKRGGRFVRVSRWQVLYPLIPLAGVGVLLWSADEHVRVEIALGVVGTVGFLVCMALFWRPMWRNVRDLWR